MVQKADIRVSSPTFRAILRFRFLMRRVSAGTTSMLVAFGCDGKRESARASTSATLILMFFVLHLPTLRGNLSTAATMHYDTDMASLSILAERSRAAVAANDSRPTVAFARSRRLFRRIGHLTVAAGRGRPGPVRLDFAAC